MDVVEKLWFRVFQPLLLGTAFAEGYPVSASIGVGMLIVYHLL